MSSEVKLCECGCGKPARRRFAIGHYIRKIKSAESRVLQYSIRNPETDCLEWQRATSGKHGYGVLYFQGHQLQAHRAIWIEKNGPIPEGIFVCHRCDNRRCVNIDHLFLGTPKDNMDDMRQKGRARLWDREKHGRSKLNWSVVALIREDRARGMTNTALAKKYGVAQSRISNVVTGKSWPIH